MLGIGPTFKLVTIFGFEIRVHASWLIIVVLLAWSLATGWFPSRLEGLSTTTYWTMGFIGSVGLFVSIVFHELSHSLVARRRGLPMRGITLFLFGGVAELSGEPEDPKTEFLVSAAGPLSSVVLGLVFLVVAAAGRAMALPETWTLVMEYLAYLNFLLVAFNIVPAFPLDGGRVLRAALWHATGSLTKATRIASQSGSVFGALLIVLGVMSLIGGNVIGGLWFALIGMFLRGAAQTGYQQLVLRQQFEGESLSRFMNTDVVTVSPEMSLENLVESFIYRHHFKTYPVLDYQGFVGAVSLKQVKDVPREDWPGTTVGDVMVPIGEDRIVAPEEDALKGLEKLRRSGQSPLFVLSGEEFVGILSLKDLVEFFQIKLELASD